MRGSLYLSRSMCISIVYLRHLESSRFISWHNVTLVLATRSRHYDGGSLRLPLPRVQNPIPPQSKPCQLQSEPHRVAAYYSK
jgi:hypothetical protein